MSEHIGWHLSRRSGLCTRHGSCPRAIRGSLEGWGARGGALHKLLGVLGSGPAGKLLSGPERAPAVCSLHLRWEGAEVMPKVPSTLVLPGRCFQNSSSAATGAPSRQMGQPRPGLLGEGSRPFSWEGCRGVGTLSCSSQVLLPHEANLPRTVAGMEPHSVPNMHQPLQSPPSSSPGCQTAAIPLPRGGDPVRAGEADLPPGAALAPHPGHVVPSLPALAELLSV